MSDSTRQAALEWINREDTVTLEDRISRLEWLIANKPENSIWLFPGGFTAQSLFEETRYCFVYGQFLAVIVLGLSYIEHTLAARIYGTGLNKLERANIGELLKKAKDLGWITQNDSNDIERAYKVRKSVVHFRKPLDPEKLESRAWSQDKSPYTVIEEDAHHVMRVMLHLLSKTTL